MLRKFKIRRNFRILYQFDPQKSRVALKKLSQLHGTKELVAKLRDANSRVRRVAAEALGALGDAEATDPLIKALDDPEESVRSIAALALGRLGDQRAVPHLIKKLASLSDSVRKAVAGALAELGDIRAVEPLAQLLDSRDLGVRLAGIEALAKMKTRSAINPLILALFDTYPQARKAAAEALKELGESKWQEWVKGDASDWQRLAPNIDRSVLGILIQAVEKGQRPDRLELIGIIGETRDRAAGDFLLGLLGTGDEKTRIRVARAVGRIGHERARSPLHQIVQNPQSHEELLAAAQALGELGDDRAIPPLIENLGGDNASLEVLLKMDKGKVTSSLIQALGHSKGNIRRAAAAALERLGDPGWREIVTGESDDFARLGRCGDRRSIPSLILALVNGDGKIRKNAADALRGLGESKWTDWVKGTEDDLKMLIKGGDVRVMEPLIVSIARSDHDHAEGEIIAGKTKQFLGALTRTLGHFDGRVRREAASLLGESGEPSAVEPLISVLEDKTQEVRVEAIRALHNLRDARATEPLLRRLNDDAGEVRQAAFRALGDMGDRRAVDPLIRILQDGKRDSEDAAYALGELGDGRAVAPLIQALEQGDEPLSARAAEALGKLNDRAAFESLVEALGRKDYRVREEAAEALVKLGDGRAIQPFIQALKGETYSRHHSGLYIGDVSFETREATHRIIIEWFGKLTDVQIVEPMIRALSGSEEDLRKAAAEAIVSRESEFIKMTLEAITKDKELRLVGALTEALKAENKTSREAAARLLIGCAKRSPKLLHENWDYLYETIGTQHIDIYHESYNECTGEKHPAGHDDTGIGLSFPKDRPDLDF